MPRQTALLLSLLLAVSLHAEGLPARGNGVTVAIICGGVDYKHPALGGGFGKGYKVAGGWDFEGNDADPFSSLPWAGTELAGIVAGDSAQVHGAAPGATLLVYSTQNIEYIGLPGSYPQLVAAIDRAVKDGADVILVERTVRGADEVTRAVERAVAAGVMVIAAVGQSLPLIPASLPLAIGVGAAPDDEFPIDSASGPPLGATEFKPDILAPGVYETALPGGGAGFFYGSEAAAAHVAGIAAQLLELHPDWTPHEVKSALMTTAIEVDAPPLTRGAGLVDAARAATEPLFVSRTALFFGVNGSTTDTWSASAAVTIENRSGRAESIELSATRVPPGTTISFTPPKLDLPANGKAEVRVELVMQNERTGFEELRLGGDIVLRGSATWRIPWALMRATRVQFPQMWGVTYGMTGIGPNGTFGVYYDQNGTGETYLAPGRYDFFRYDCRWYECWLYIIESRNVSGDAVNIDPSPPTYEIELAAHDPNGNRLRDLPRGESRVYSTRTIMRCPGCPNNQIVGVSGSKLYVSKVSERFSFHSVETYLDLEQRRGFRVAHEPLRGVAGRTVLRRGLSDYTRAYLHWQVRPAGNTVSFCDAHYFWFGSVSYVAPSACARKAVKSDLIIGYFATPEEMKTHPRDFVGVVLRDEEAVSPVIQSKGGGFLVSSDPTPSQFAPVIGPGQAMRFKEKLLHPFGFVSEMFYGAMRDQLGFRGSLGEVHTRDFTWKVTCEDGGTYGGTASNIPDYYYLAPNARLEVRDGDASVEVRKRIGSPPSFTSARIVNGAGELVSMVWQGADAWLQFSAADHENYRADVPKPEATRALVRRTGATEWSVMTPVVVANEGRKEYGIGAGDVYRAGLASLASGRYDLQLQIEDKDGNVVTFTQPGAFIIQQKPPARGAGRGSG